MRGVHWDEAVRAIKAVLVFILGDVSLLLDRQTLEKWPLFPHERQSAFLAGQVVSRMILTPAELTFDVANCLVSVGSNSTFFI